jgi:FkbM family methyltransferase
MTGRFEATLRGAVMGTWLEPSARFVWKKILRRQSKNDVYDRLTIDIMRKVLRPESNCVDVGCHAGAILDEMLRLSPDGLHYAFEPLPDLAAKLRQRYAGRPNIVFREAALSNAAGTATFHANRDHPGMSGLRRRDYVSENDTVELIEVQTDRLDALLPSDVKIDFMKVDVEGAESLVFEGGLESLARSRPVIVFEHGLASREYYNTESGVVFDLLSRASLRVSCLEEFGRDGAALTRERFIEHVENGLDFYFVAHAEGPPSARSEP